MNNRIKVFFILALGLFFSLGYANLGYANSTSAKHYIAYYDSLVFESMTNYGEGYIEVPVGDKLLDYQTLEGDGMLTETGDPTTITTEDGLLPTDPYDLTVEGDHPTTDQLDSTIEEDQSTTDPNGQTAEGDQTASDQITDSETQLDPTNDLSIINQKTKKYISGYTSNGRLMVPIRTISEYLDLQVKFENGRLIVENFVRTVEFIPGSNKYYVNGNEYVAETKIFMVSGQNYVPFNVIAKSFDIPYYHNQLNNWIELSGDNQDLYIYIKPETSMYAYKPKEVVSLMYHHFQDGIAENGVVISPERFREHLHALKAQGYETITEQDYLNYQQGNTDLPLKPLIITIDDGYESNYLEAFPILAEEGYKATVYLTTSKAETKPGYMQYMNWEQMKEMVDSGVMDIQSHTHDLHYQLPKNGTNRGYALVDKLPYEDHTTWAARIKEDMRTSKQLIEENLGNKVYAFAYPYGVYSDAVVNLLKQEGYTVGFTIDQGKNTKYNSPMKLKRYTADGRFTGDYLVSMIK